MSTAELPQLAVLFVLTFARVGTLIMLLPGFGERVFPSRLRLSLAVLLTLLLIPVVRGTFGVVPSDFAGQIGLLLSEVLTGLALGLGVRILTFSMATAGSIIAQQIGLGFVTQVDPTQGGQSVLLANFLTLFGIVTIFVLDLHHLSIAAIHNSYALMPPGGRLALGDITEMAIGFVTRSFVLSVQMAAPFLVAGIVFQVALGVLSRLMPQLQILFIAIPVQLVAGFALLSAVLGTILTVYGTSLGEALSSIAAR